MRLGTFVTRIKAQIDRCGALTNKNEDAKRGLVNKDGASCSRGMTGGCVDFETRSDSAVSAAVVRPRGQSGAHPRTDTRPRARGHGRVRAEHSDTRSKLGTSEGDHMLANMRGHDLSVLWARMRQDILYKVVAVLVAGNVDERNAWSVDSALAHTIKVAIEKLWPADLEALLNHLGRELVRAIFGRITDDMVDRTASVTWGSMFADVLNAPVAKLTVGYNVNIGENLLNAGSLAAVSQLLSSPVERLTLSSSKQFSKMFWTTRLPVSPSATSCHIPDRASLTYFIICGGDSVHRSSNSFCHTWQA